MGAPGLSAGAPVEVRDTRKTSSTESNEIFFTVWDGFHPGSSVLAVWSQPRSGCHFFFGRTEDTLFTLRTDTRTHEA